MKAKKFLLLLAPVALVLSCNPTGKKIIDLSKLNIKLTEEGSTEASDKTLVMGKLASKSNENSEQMITIDTENKARATEFTFSENGVNDIVTSDVKLTRFVKLDKYYAVMSCVYNEVTYDRIVDLTDGTCYKFPDSSMLPNVKERFASHKEYREYFNTYSYLNDNIVQLGTQIGEAEVFYYINEFDVKLEDGSTKAVRRLCELTIDEVNKNFNVRAVVTPEDNRSVQSFAVNDDRVIVYFTSEEARLKDGVKPDKAYYTINGYVTYSIDEAVIEEGYSLEPYLYTGRDGIIYCYLNKDDKHYSGTISYMKASTTLEIKTVEAAAPLDNLPKKILNLFTTVGNNLLEKTFSIFSGEIAAGAKTLLGELFTLVMNLISEDNIQTTKSVIPNIRWPWQRDSDYKSEKKEVSGEQLSFIIDGFSGYSFGYLFGKNSDNKNVLKRIKCDSETGKTYSYDVEVLTTFTGRINEIESIINDGAIEDLTVIARLDEDTNNSVITLGENEVAGTKIDSIADATVAVDILDDYKIPELI